MRQAGRVSIPLVIAIVFVVFVVGLLLVPSHSPTAAAGEFMIALAKGDTKKLAELSYIQDRSPDELRKEWDETMAASKHFRFQWNIRNTSQASEDEASVIMDYTKNFGAGGDYSENTQLPMIRKNGKWMVDLRSLNRGVFPFLPR